MNTFPFHLLLHMGAAAAAMVGGGRGDTGGSHVRLTGRLENLLSNMQFYHFLSLTACKGHQGLFLFVGCVRQTSTHDSSAHNEKNLHLRCCLPFLTRIPPSLNRRRRTRRLTRPADSQLMCHSLFRLGTAPSYSSSYPRRYRLISITVRRRTFPVH